MNPITSILAPIGILLMIALGYRQYPWGMSMILGTLVFGIAYSILRIRQLSETFRRDGIRSGLLVFYLLVVQIAISSGFYFLGKAAAVLR